MLYSAVPPSTVNNASSGYNISFDSTSEEFDTTFPIVLMNRVNPQKHLSTVQTCSQIMKKHMEKIDDNHTKVFLKTFLAIMLGSMICVGLACLIYFTAYAHYPDQGVWVWIVFPSSSIFIVLGVVVWSFKRVARITQIHQECKKELADYLQSENQNFYFSQGIQYVLRYEIAVATNNRYYQTFSYKFLLTMPCIEVYVNHAPQTFIVATPMEGYQTTGTTGNVFANNTAVVTQPPVSTIYSQPFQPVDEYAKQNRPLLANNDNHI
ncbi:hypothetical protein C9374_013299 [Naegleria lovaniensis]|uniref:Uncharacterized protein n=1 Tax=Naegleria lovaniensis TaxID=51637 RepID=A0AA88GWH5_NAELO|nr:uncharacterized protein C9374_013299 [Naegleria lovaniensis]KAG2391814.1 hypothetical protein C9374_013299 [Naegleria lovaniensis]